MSRLCRGRNIPGFGHISMTASTQLGPIQPERGQPLYSAVRETILHAVDEGHFAPGDQLPSTKALSETLSVSLVTVHRALGELVSSGVLERGQGRGTFVHHEYVRRGRQGTATRFGLVFQAECSLADSYHGQLLEGVRQESADSGLDLVLLRYGEDWRKECRGYLYVNPLDSQLAHPPTFEGRVSKTGSRKNGTPPIMVVGARADRDDVGCIDTDNHRLAALAVEHLASLGHTRIGYVGDPGEVSNSRDRWMGFTEACERTGVTCPDRFVMRVNGWTLEDDEVEQLRGMLALPGAPTAIFAAGYYFSLGVYSAIKRAGLRIPEDIAVVGVDDPPSAAHLSPSLSTLRQPLVDVGRHAVRALLEWIDEPARDPVRMTLEPELIARASSVGEAVPGGNAGTLNGRPR